MREPTLAFYGSRQSKETFSLLSLRTRHTRFNTKGNHTGHNRTPMNRSSDIDPLLRLWKILSALPRYPSRGQFQSCSVNSKPVNAASEPIFFLFDLRLYVLATSPFLYVPFGPAQTQTRWPNLRAGLYFGGTPFTDMGYSYAS